jgi:hypothetical protein
LFLNGQELQTRGGTPVPLPKLLPTEKNVVVLVAQQDDHLSAPLEFLSGTTPFSLKAWTKTALANFSGTAIYEKDFALPDSYHGRRIVLDLGRVSAVAEVNVNGHAAGTLVWRPYRLDITPFLKPGQNHLRIRVTNTEANARAVGPSHGILSRIDVCGLEGPVTIIPYVDQTLALKIGEK